MKLLCTGDLHLGAGSDYGREPGERLAEQRNVWETIAALAIEEDVDALLFAGDAWERRRPTPGELLAFKAGIDMLRDHDIQIVAIAGNHDVEAMERPTAYELFPDTDALFVYLSAPTVVRTFGANGGEVNVAGLPWTPVSRLVAANGGGDRDDLNDRAAELLLAAARDLRGSITNDLPSILLLHWAVSGACIPSGIPTDQLREPVIPLGELQEIGFDAIVMGHIHSQQLIATNPREPEIPVFYVGSPMPLNFGEARDEHGVWILNTETWVPEFVPVESRPLVTLDLDGAQMFTLDGTAWQSQIDGAIVKARYKATADEARRIDHAKIRDALYEAGTHKVFSIEPTIEREQRARVADVADAIGEATALDMWISANEIAAPLHRGLRERNQRYLHEVAA